MPVGDVPALPAQFSPALLLLRVEEGPGHQTALLLALPHDDGLVLHDICEFQCVVDRGQAGRFRHQRRKPETACGNPGAFADHAQDEALLAALAPEFGALTPEISPRAFRIGVLAEVRPFALVRLSGFGGRRMKWRITHGQIEPIVVADQAFKHSIRRRLQAQGDLSFHLRVGIQNSLRVFERCRIDVGRHEAPAVFAVSDQRVDATGAGTDIQHLHGWRSRHHAAIAVSQQISQIMQIIGATGNRRAQALRWNVPFVNAVAVFQQGAVQCFDGGRVGKIYASVAVGFGRDKIVQRRLGRDQAGEVIAGPVSIARMEFAVRRGGPGGLKFLFDRLHAGAYSLKPHAGTVGGCHSAIKYQ